MKPRFRIFWLRPSDYLRRIGCTHFIMPVVNGLVDWNADGEFIYQPVTLDEGT